MDAVFRKLGFRYFHGHSRRYIFLIVSISFGFAVITIMTSLTQSMSSNVHQSARSHYGGDLMVWGRHKQLNNIGLIQESDIVEQAIRDLPIQPERVTRRTLSFGDSILYFDGNGIRMKYLYGVDFGEEEKDFNTMDFTEGGLSYLDGSKGIIISQVAALKLGAALGDDILVKVRTKTGQVNTGTFVIQGIFRDESIFGYFKGFISRRELNRLLSFEDDQYYSLGLYFDRYRDAQKMSSVLYDSLKNKIALSPPIKDKKDLAYQQDRYWVSIRHFIVTLDVLVSQVTNLISAMNMVSYFLYVMISVIILVSTAVTYRLIIFERTSEIGTLRAMGFQKTHIIRILLWEAVFAYLIGIIAGFLLSLAVLGGIFFIDFSFIPGFELFLNRGRLYPVFTIIDLAFNIGLLAVIIIPALLIPFRRVSELKLDKALSGDQ